MSSEHINAEPRATFLLRNFVCKSSVRMGYTTARDLNPSGNYRKVSQQHIANSGIEPVVSNLLIANLTLYHRAAQPVAHGPHLAREAVLRGLQGLFAWMISSWKGLLSIFWQINRSKPKPFSVCFSQNQHGFAAKTFFFFFWSSPTSWDRFPQYWLK